MSIHWFTLLAVFAWAFVVGVMYHQHDCIEGVPFNKAGHWYRCILDSPEPPRWGCK